MLRVLTFFVPFCVTFSLTYTQTDVFCIADELHRATGKAVDVYELCELERGSPFYNSVMSEGVQVA